MAVQELNILLDRLGVALMRALSSHFKMFNWAFVYNTS